MQAVTFILFVEFTSGHTDDTNVIGEAVDGTSVGAVKEREREREGEREGREKEREGGGGGGGGGREREGGREGGRVSTMTLYLL